MIFPSPPPVGSVRGVRSGDNIFVQRGRWQRPGREAESETPPKAGLFLPYLPPLRDKKTPCKFGVLWGEAPGRGPRSPPLLIWVLIRSVSVKAAGRPGGSSGRIFAVFQRIWVRSPRAGTDPGARRRALPLARCCARAWPLRTGPLDVFFPALLRVSDPLILFFTPISARRFPLPRRPEIMCKDAQNLPLHSTMALKTPPCPKRPFPTPR